MPNTSFLQYEQADSSQKVRDLMRTIHEKMTLPTIFQLDRESEEDMGGVRFILDETSCHSAELMGPFEQER